MRRKEVNLLANQILTAHDNRYVNKILNDYDFFNDVEGVLTEENATMLILRSLKNRSLSCILPRMLEFSNANTISDDVFSMIKEYPNKTVKRNILISLAHCNISFYQLNYICEAKVCLEAFASLLDIYLYCKYFSTIDLVRLLNNNSEFIKGIDWEIILNDSLVEAEKKQVVLSYF